MTEKQSLIALCSYIPFGPARINLLVDYFKSAANAWRAEKKNLLEIGLGEERVSSFLIHRDNFDAVDYFTRLKKLSIKVVTKDESNYPENLRELDNAPAVLYVKGDFKASDVNSVAVVGSRKMTSYGREVTENFSSELASLGVTIVSGLARGVDTVAHEATLEANGRTIAVLGCGLDKIYPPSNIGLAQKIVKSGGALISEYPLGYPALPVNFANRNRIISGLSKAILVVEGAEKSGTLLTASHAAEQGRAVFAVPGQITSPLSAAPLFLIKSGAKMATKVSDILEELDLQLQLNRDEIEKILPANSDEQKLLTILENEPLHLDEVARISTLKVSEVSARLTMMEIKGMVKDIGGGIYKKI